MYRLFPYIPIFRGFSIKNCQKMCMYVWVKNDIVTCEKFIFCYEKGYEWILALDSPKTYYLYTRQTLNKLSNIKTQAEIWISSFQLSLELYVVYMCDETG